MIINILCGGEATYRRMVGKGNFVGGRFMMQEALERALREYEGLKLLLFGHVEPGVLGVNFPPRSQVKDGPKDEGGLYKAAIMRIQDDEERPWMYFAPSKEVLQPLIRKSCLFKSIEQLEQQYNRIVKGKK